MGLVEAVTTIVVALIAGLGYWLGRKSKKETNQNDLTELQQKAIEVLLAPLTKRVEDLEK